MNRLAVSFIDASLQELELHLQEILTALERAKGKMDAAVFDEREACAKIAEAAGRNGHPHDPQVEIMRCTGALIADSIRRRNTGTDQENECPKTPS